MAVVRAGPGDRAATGLLLAGLVAWLGYTRFFWTLRGAHATLPFCPFLAVTGQPCPLCGGSRSFAAMWQADVRGAFHYHPLGPILFAGTLVAALGALVLLLTGRRLHVDMGLEKAVYVGSFAVLVAAWAFRLVLLPLPAAP